MSYDISDMSDMPKWRRGVVGLSRHVILSSDMSDISDISEMSDMSDIPYTQHTYRHPSPSSYFKTRECKGVEGVRGGARGGVQDTEEAQAKGREGA